MTLHCKFLLSKDAQEAKEAISKFIQKANEVLLLKGVPKGKEEKASQIVDWELKKNVLSLEIKSGTYVRAPSAILRIRRDLQGLLGKFKIGIRGINVKSFQTSLPLAKPISKESLKKIQEIYGIDKAELTGRNLLELSFIPLSYKELKQGIPDKIIRLIEEVIRKEEAIVPVPQILKQGRKRKMKFKEDPVKIASKLGWIKKFPGRGQWIYCPPYAILQETIENILVEEVAHKLGFKPCLIPKLIPFSIMKDMPGYFENMPEGMYYVCPPPRESEKFSGFKRIFRIKKEVPIEELRKVLKAPSYVLAPAQCEPFWYLFSHKVLELEKLPIKLYDRSGWTYRWEGGGVEGLVRLQEFKRIELVYFGSPEDVVNIRDEVLEENIRIADEILNLEWRVVPDIPFWAKEWEALVDIKDSRNVPAYDLEVYLPYRGPRTKDSWIEISGCFIHKLTYIEAFKTKEKRGKEIWTGCTGMGVSRWTSAFLSQHGFCFDDWPPYIKKKCEKFKQIFA